MTKQNKNILIRTTAILSVAAISALAALTAGCESTEFKENVSWNGSAPAQEANNNQESETTTPTANEGGGGASGVGDAVSYGSFKWNFGGVKGGGASQQGVQISGLSLSPGGLSFKYNTNLSAWGMSHGQIGALACLFVQNSSGQWVGGKFDWISSSRNTRDFHNVYSGYNGWSLAGVPNPCNAAFVIISPDGKKRSNVITGTWKR
ncbi:MAG: hypothetical protein GX804_05110 [Lentisphaerae bacterium]|jgi:hypothetical protein|nr:hypothetical protein [Lentisphaerota bacterium]